MAKLIDKLCPIYSTKFKLIFDNKINCYWNENEIYFIMDLLRKIEVAEKQQYEDIMQTAYRRYNEENVFLCINNCIIY